MPATEPAPLWIETPNGKIHSLHFGKGEKLLIIFHGFADRADLFLRFADILEDYFEVVAVDLPYHGLSEWDLDSFQPADIQHIVEQILQHTQKQRFSIMAHSMGGFVGLKLYELIPEKVEYLLMLAPGGVYKALPFNPLLFNFSVRRFFRYTMGSRFLPKILQLVMKFKLLHRSFYEFINLHFANQKRRQRLFNSWVSLYHFHLNLEKIKTLLQQNQSFICFFYGSKDKITPARAARKFIKNIPNSELRLVEGENHFFIKEPLKNELAAWLSERFRPQV